MATQKKAAATKAEVEPEVEATAEVEAQEVHEVAEGSDAPFVPITDDIMVLNERVGHPINAEGEPPTEPEPEPPPER